MTNEKKPNTGDAQSAADKTKHEKSMPGHGDKSKADKKPDQKGKASEQTKR